MKSGKVVNVKAKVMGSPCKCKKNCSEKLSYEQQLKIFQDFWDIGDIMMRWSFIAKWVKRENKKSHRWRKERTTKIKRRSREYSYKYYFADPNSENAVGEIEVCQAFFLATTKITKKVIANVFKEKIETKTGTLIPEALRKLTIQVKIKKIM